MFVNGYDLHRIQVVRSQTKLAAEEAERAADDMSPHADRRVFAEGNNGSPSLKQGLECLAHGRARFDGNRAEFGVIHDALHRGDVDDHPYVRIGNEAFEAVPAARNNDALAFPHSGLEGRRDLRCRPDDVDVVRLRFEALVELLVDRREVARVASTESRCFEHRCIVCGFAHGSHSPRHRGGLPSSSGRRVPALG